MKKLVSFLFTAAAVAVCALICLHCAGSVVLPYYKWNYTEPAEPTDIGSPYKHCYNGLENIEKHAYNEILLKIYDMPEKISIPAIGGDSFNKVFSALLCDNPDLFFVGRKCTLTSHLLATDCAIEYIIDKEEYAAQKAELDSICDAVVSSFTSPDDEWQTEKEIHDYITENCEYKIVESEHVYSSAYGALVNGEAACEGYSKAAKLLFDKAGIESSVVSGISRGFDGEYDPHMWNAVKINGDFYYLDCTWDDPVSSDGKEYTAYSYFNVSDEMIESTHTDISQDFGCDSTEENYFIKTGRYFSAYDRSCEKKLASLVAEELDSGSDTLQLRFGSKKVYDKAVADLIGSGRIYNVLKSAKNKTTVDFSTESLSYYKTPDQLLLTVILETD